MKELFHTSGRFHPESEKPESGSLITERSIFLANQGKDYHYSDSKTSTSLNDPLFTTKFTTTFILPPALRAVYGTQLISEQLKKVGGLSVDKMPDPVIAIILFVMVGVLFPHTLEIMLTLLLVEFLMVQIILIL